MKTIFVGGIHGVGKTTACGNAATQLGIRHATASDIIRGRRHSAVNVNSKRVSDVTENQKLLIEGVDALRRSATPLLLDGHFSLIGPEGEIGPVAEQVFKELDLAGVAVFHDDTKLIARRLRERDGTAQPEGLLDLLQRIEISTARNTAKAIGMKCAELNAFDTHGLVAYVRAVSALG